jgi:hypothetical protein
MDRDQLAQILMLARLGSTNPPAEPGRFMPKGLWPFPNPNAPSPEAPPPQGPTSRAMIENVALRGDNPMGGPQGYANDILEGPGPHSPQPPPPALPQGWLPPWQQTPPPVWRPPGPATPDNPEWYDPQAHPIPPGRPGRLNRPGSAAEVGLRRGGAKNVLKRSQFSI